MSICCILGAWTRCQSQKKTSNQLANSRLYFDGPKNAHYQPEQEKQKLSKQELSETKKKALKGLHLHHNIFSIRRTF